MEQCTLHGDDCALDEEILVLEAIYINELTVIREDHGHASDIRLVLHPATADELDRQFVKITLVIKPTMTYPDDVPEITIENSRGLSDRQLLCLSEALHLHAQTLRGWPMLHELIETAKDTLTAGNVPHCPCAICLDHFTNEDSIYKTHCYHYYHPECLQDYVVNWRSTVEESNKTAKEPMDTRLIPCPICREDMDLDDLPQICSQQKRSSSPVEVVYVPDPYVKALQSKMQELYLKQKEKGGIIDLEAEKNKFLVQNGEVLVPANFIDEPVFREPFREPVPGPSSANGMSSKDNPRTQRRKDMEAGKLRDHDNAKRQNLNSARRAKSNREPRYFDQDNRGPANRKSNLRPNSGEKSHGPNSSEKSAQYRKSESKETKPNTNPRNDKRTSLSSENRPPAKSGQSQKQDRPESGRRSKRGAQDPCKEEKTRGQKLENGAEKDTGEKVEKDARLTRMENGSPRDKDQISGKEVVGKRSTGRRPHDVPESGESSHIDNHEQGNERNYISTSSLNTDDSSEMNERRSNRARPCPPGVSPDKGEVASIPPNDTLPPCSTIPGAPTLQESNQNGEYSECAPLRVSIPESGNSHRIDLDEIFTEMKSGNQAGYGGLSLQDIASGLHNPRPAKPEDVPLPYTGRGRGTRRAEEIRSHIESDKRGRGRFIRGMGGPRRGSARGRFDKPPIGRQNGFSS